MEKIKVLIIDDSAVVRKYLTDVLSTSRNIEILGTALDPYIAAKKIQKLNPDVITLDIEMPRMDGLTFLSKLMIANPMPVIMVSSLTDKGAAETMKALELGAVDFICKPALDNEDATAEFSENLVEKVLAVKGLKIKRKSVVKPMEVEEKNTADVILAKKNSPKFKSSSEKVIAIGASTGGTEVLDQILVELPDSLPGIVITQHMPEKFTEAFAERINSKSRLYVKEAEHRERLNNGMVLIAPGGKHMLLHNDKDGYWVEINDGPAVNRHKPSVDVLFRSVSQAAGKSAVGILCTGMGNDGAAGLLEMKEAGAATVAQDEASSIVYGMPREAVKLGAADMQLDIKGITGFLIAGKK
ncbi:MAG: chemotaxis response regulator protein-glutamate methylesterase [bacterium]|nr:chemotaxis response regulator protein-glutamate methylesterase [bacterium]